MHRELQNIFTNIYIYRETAINAVISKIVTLFSNLHTVNKNDYLNFCRISLKFIKE